MTGTGLSDFTIQLLNVSADSSEGRNGDSFSSDILGESDHAMMATRIFVASLSELR